MRLYRNATVSYYDTRRIGSMAGADVSISTGITANACAGNCDARSITRYPLQEEFP